MKFLVLAKWNLLEPVCMRKGKCFSHGGKCLASWETVFVQDMTLVPHTKGEAGKLGVHLNRLWAHSQLDVCQEAQQGVPWIVSCQFDTT